MTTTDSSQWYSLLGAEYDWAVVFNKNVLLGVINQSIRLKFLLTEYYSAGFALEKERNLVAHKMMTGSHKLASITLLRYKACFNLPDSKSFIPFVLWFLLDNDNEVFLQ